MLITRRRFVQGIAASAAIAALDPWRLPDAAAEIGNRRDGLSSRHFDLAIEETPVNFTGRSAIATTVDGTVPGPLLRWCEGDDVTIAVTNRLKEQTSIHWHGIRLPSDMDGVPGLSFPGIDAGQRFTYRFQVRQRGTYWYHAHSEFQEQTGLYGPIIIDPAGKEPAEFDRDYVIMLADWSDEDPATIYRNLKQDSSYYNHHQRTLGSFVSDVRKQGLSATLSDRLMWGAMNMSPTDLSDVNAATYTYLLNGVAPATNWTALFRKNERIRLRFINASSMTIFDVRIPGLLMKVVQADGNDVEPVEVDEFRISVAETYDVIVEPHEELPYTIFTQSLDRTGYARGTLAPHPGMSAAIPPMDPRPELTMVDMGMGDMSENKAMSGMKMPSVSKKGAGTPAATGNTSASAMDMSGMSDEEMKNMPGMTMATMTPAASPTPSAFRAAGGEPIGQPGPDVIPLGPPSKAIAVSSPTTHDVTALSLGPEVDNIATMPTERLNDPGIGLNGNGRRVLTYADLKARYRSTDLRTPSRTIELHMTGNMERFIWGFDGKKLGEAAPIRLRLGERVRFVLINDTMMNHPIHLHGFWSELENGFDEFRPYKHTINVKPGERLSFLVTADAPGPWAFHCHLLYHMEGGMFRTVIVS